MGVCPQDSYYAEEQCCWLNNETFIDTKHCDAWHEWSTHLSIHLSPYAFDYFVYVTFTVLFAGLAGLFVVVLAPYASGSGIPEVRKRGREREIHLGICTCISIFAHV